MLSEQTSLLVVNIDVVNCIKELQRAWLVRVVNDNSKLSSFIKPVECVNLFI